MQMKCLNIQEKYIGMQDAMDICKLVQDEMIKLHLLFVSRMLNKIFYWRVFKMLLSIFVEFDW